MLISLDFTQYIYENCRPLLKAVDRSDIEYKTVIYIHHAGADLGFSERGANDSSGSLKQGVWGVQPPRSYRIFCFMKYRNAT